MQNESPYSFRAAREEDYDALYKLFDTYFGKMATEGGAMSNLSNRYLVACYEDRIVAVTGVIPPEKSNYNGYEISWTCTDANHRGRGLIVAMMQMIIEKLPSDAELYCDCWRLFGKDRPNLYNVMQMSGFTEVIHDRIKRKFPHSSECHGCPYATKGCFCFGDLYKLRR